MYTGLHDVVLMHALLGAVWSRSYVNHMSYKTQAHRTRDTRERGERPRKKTVEPGTGKRTRHTTRVSVSRTRTPQRGGINYNVRATTR